MNFDNFALCISPEFQIAQAVAQLTQDVVVKDISPEHIEENIDLIQQTKYFILDPRVYKQIKDKLKSAVWIQSAFAGVDAFFTHNFSETDVLLTRYSGEMGNVMAEYVICQLVTFERNFHLAKSYQDQRVWDMFEFLGYRSLKNMVIGILGFGLIGRKVAQVCKSFDMTVWAMKRTIREGDHCDYVDHLCTGSGLNYLLESCDYVCSILPSTRETDGILNNALEHCAKRKSIFINVGRGNSISNEALITAVEKKWIRGAIIDVFAEEPLPKESKLWTLPNVIITPHVAAAVSESTIAELFLENYRRLKSNRPLKFSADKTVGY